MYDKMLILWQSLTETIQYNLQIRLGCNNLVNDIVQCRWFALLKNWGHFTQKTVSGQWITVKPSEAYPSRFH